jgi:hypothetical protein
MASYDYIARLKAGSEICLRQSKLLLRSIEIRLRRSKLNPALLGSARKITIYRVMLQMGIGKSGTAQNPAASEMRLARGRLLGYTGGHVDIRGTF